jgi:calcineurin-like phosphoesterase family protein
VNIAVFSDVHGRILLCFLLCARWERETGERIDAVLQAGDLGAFPSEEGMDRATLRHGRHDSTEFGFSTDFAHYREDVARALERTQCPLIFVRGNHEDQTWLDALERQSDGPLFPIDAYQRIYCLKTGVPYTLRAGDESLTVLGIGRVGPPIGETEPQKPKYIQEHEMERLYNLGPLSLVALLTHDVPLHSRQPYLGMEEIRLILDAYKPRYHFYGHTEEPYREQLDSNGVTRSLRLADLNWRDERTPGRLSPAVMGLLRWRSRDDNSFEVVDAPWLDEYNRWSWQAHLWGVPGE